MGEVCNLSPICEECRNNCISVGKSAFFQNTTYYLCCLCKNKNCLLTFPYWPNKLTRVYVCKTCFLLLNLDNSNLVKRMILMVKKQTLNLFKTILNNCLKQTSVSGNYKTKGTTNTIKVLEEALRNKIRDNIVMQQMGFKKIDVTPESLVEGFHQHELLKAVAEPTEVCSSLLGDSLISNSNQLTQKNSNSSQSLDDSTPGFNFQLPQRLSTRMCEPIQTRTPMVCGKKLDLTNIESTSRFDESIEVNTLEMSTTQMIANCYNAIKKHDAMSLPQLFPFMNLKISKFFDLSGECQSGYEVSARELLDFPAMRHFALLKMTNKRNKKCLTPSFLASIDPNTKFMVSHKPVTLLEIKDEVLMRNKVILAPSPIVIKNYCASIVPLKICQNGRVIDSQVMKKTNVFNQHVQSETHSQRQSFKVCQQSNQPPGSYDTNKKIPIHFVNNSPIHNILLKGKSNVKFCASENPDFNNQCSNNIPIPIITILPKNAHKISTLNVGKTVPTSLTQSVHIKNTSDKSCIKNLGSVVSNKNSNQAKLQTSDHMNYTMLPMKKILSNDPSISDNGSALPSNKMHASYNLLPMSTHSEASNTSVASSVIFEKPKNMRILIKPVVISENNKKYSIHPIQKFVAGDLNSNACVSSKSSHANSNCIESIAGENKIRVLKITNLKNTSNLLDNGFANCNNEMSN